MPPLPRPETSALINVLLLHVCPQQQQQRQLWGSFLIFIHPAIDLLRKIAQDVEDPKTVLIFDRVMVDFSLADLSCFYWKVDHGTRIMFTSCFLSYFLRWILCCLLRILLHVFWDFLSFYRLFTNFLPIFYCYFFPKNKRSIRVYSDY